MPTRPEPTDRDLLARADRRDVFIQTRHSALLEAVVAGCALIARADGWITPEERRRMVAFLRQNNTLSAFGAEEALVLFEQLADRFLTDHDAAEARAFEAVQQVQDHPRHATLLMEACCQVALADGMFDGDERETALRIARLLRVNPQRFELTAA